MRFDKVDRGGFDTLRKHCASLPGATRDIKWGADECYSVGGRMFAVFGIEGGKARGVSFKVDDERFLELTDRDGVIPAPYLARAHWVLLERGNALPVKEAKALLARSHALVAARLTKKAREAALGAHR
ncbi:MAG TPA: MmcQ/YjbR family DNA-binding protein [Casimicrobiaceae bacterium]|nr:MmcQ/YjbR family DNA-binding protein [Casimicrobiaceae bacterium]